MRKITAIFLALDGYTTYPNSVLPDGRATGRSYVGYRSRRHGNVRQNGKIRTRNGLRPTSRSGEAYRLAWQTAIPFDNSDNNP